MEIVKQPISIVDATQMPKSELINFLFEDESDNMTEIPFEKSFCSSSIEKEKYHSGTHVLDTRDGEIINLINYGKRLCLIN